MQRRKSQCVRVGRLEGEERKRRKSQFLTPCVQIHCPFIGRPGRPEDVHGAESTHQNRGGPPRGRHQLGHHAVAGMHRHGCRRPRLPPRGQLYAKRPPTHSSQTCMRRVPTATRARALSWVTQLTPPRMSIAVGPWHLSPRLAWPLHSSMVSLAIVQPSYPLVCKSCRRRCRLDSRPARWASWLGSNPPRCRAVHARRASPPSWLG